MNLGAMEFDDVVPSLGGAYLQVHGDWHPPNDPPESTPHWTPARYIWFRVATNPTSSVTLNRDDLSLERATSCFQSARFEN